MQLINGGLSSKKVASKKLPSALETKSQENDLATKLPKPRDCKAFKDISFKRKKKANLNSYCMHDDVTALLFHINGHIA